MADLFLGQTCTEAYQVISAGTAHTFAFNFQPDKVVFNNLTAWTATAGKLPISVWFRNQTVASHASQQQVIDSSAGASFNFLDTATNGFVVADIASGVPSFRALIAGVSQADPCVITTTVPNSFQTDQIVRITDLGNVGSGAAARGMDQLNNNRYLITVLTTTTFSIRDVITDEPIDSTSFTAWVSGGRLDIESRVISLNNPQVAPYAVTPYIPNPFEYNPTTYQLTAGTSVMGSDGDVFLIEVYKWGQLINLGDLLV